MQSSSTLDSDPDCRYDPTPSSSQPSPRSRAASTKHPSRSPAPPSSAPTMVATRKRRASMLPSSSLSALGDELGQAAFPPDAAPPLLVASGSTKRARSGTDEDDEEDRNEQSRDSIEGDSVEQTVRQEDASSTQSTSTLQSAAATVPRTGGTFRFSQAPPECPVEPPSPTIVIKQEKIGDPVVASPARAAIKQDPFESPIKPMAKYLLPSSPMPASQALKRTPEMIAERRRLAEEIRQDKLRAKAQADQVAKREAAQLRYVAFANKQLGSFGFTVQAKGVTKFGTGTGGGNGVKGDPSAWRPDERCSEEQRRVLENIRDDGNVFFTGSAGVGKSFLLQEITRLLEFLGRPFQVTATTGIAALQVNGATLHSFAGMGLGLDPIYSSLEKMGKDKRKNWNSTQVLIIDEISMVSPVFFEKLNILAKLIRNDRRAFGGLQIIVSGDYFQLPPVPDKNPKCMRCGSEGLQHIPFETSTLASEKPYEQLRPESTKHSKQVDVVTDAEIFRCSDLLERNRKSGEMVKVSEGCGFEMRGRRFAFETDSWAECRFKVMELTKVFRQTDIDYIKMLEKFRRGICDPESVAMLKTCGRGLADLGSIKPTNLYPLRRSVDEENVTEFKKLQGIRVVFEADDASRGDRANAVRKTRLRDVPAAETIELKLGAQVLLLANVDITNGLVNGSRGVIVDWRSMSEKVPDSPSAVKAKGKGVRGGGGMGSEDWKDKAAQDWKEKQVHDKLPVVCFASGATIVVQPWSWVIDVDRDNTCARTQMPLALAWALTIHKSQGQSLDAVGVKLGSTFERGQAYVALSRCRTPAGMQVEGFSPSHIMAHPTVKRFYTRIALDQPFYESTTVPIINPLAYFPPHYPFNGMLRQTFSDPPPRLPIGSAVYPGWINPSIAALDAHGPPATFQLPMAIKLEPVASGSNYRPQPQAAPTDDWRGLLRRASIAYAVTNNPDYASFVATAFRNLQDALPKDQVDDGTAEDVEVVAHTGCWPESSGYTTAAGTNVIREGAEAGMLPEEVIAEARSVWETAEGIFEHEQRSWEEAKAEAAKMGVAGYGAEDGQALDAELQESKKRRKRARRVGG